MEELKGSSYLPQTPPRHSIGAITTHFTFPDISTPWDGGLPFKEQINELLTWFHDEAGPFSKVEFVSLTQRLRAFQKPQQCSRLSSSYQLEDGRILRLWLFERWHLIFIQLVHAHLVNCGIAIAFGSAFGRLLSEEKVRAHTPYGGHFLYRAFCEVLGMVAFCYLKFFSFPRCILSVLEHECCPGDGSWIHNYSIVKGLTDTRAAVSQIACGISTVTAWSTSSVLGIYSIFSVRMSSYYWWWPKTKSLSLNSSSQTS